MTSPSLRSPRRSFRPLPWLALALFAAAPPLLVAQTFAPTGPMTEPRANHSATLLLDGKVLVAGGGTPDRQGLQTAELYDPATGQWRATGALAVKRGAHTATRIADGRVLVFGGGNAFGQILSSEVYDPATGVWQTNGPISKIRFGYTATHLTDGRILLAGGSDGTAELYDPETGKWTATGAMTSPRLDHSATLLPDGKVLVAGGYRASSPYYLKSMELYDPATRQWTETTPMLTERRGHEAFLIPGGAVFFRGGVDAGQRLVPAGIYHLDTRAWSVGDNSSFGSSNYSDPVTELPDGRFLVAGGFFTFVGFSAYFDTALVFDPATTRWSSDGVGMLKTARAFHTATRLLNGQVLIAGGKGKGGFLTSSELFGPPGMTGLEILLSTPIRLPNGGWQFDFPGPPGTSFVAFGTSDLTVPFANWEALGDAVEITAGHFRFTDPAPPETGARFYRVGTL